MKSEPFFGMAILQRTAQVLALLFCVSLLIAAGIEVYQVYKFLWSFDIAAAMQEGLFTLILLEMVFVVRSFIKYGSVNTALIISVGVVAVIKALIFNIEEVTLYTAISYSLLLITLTVGFLLENYTYGMKVSQGRQQRSISEKIQEEYANFTLESTNQELASESVLAAQENS